METHQSPSASDPIQLKPTKSNQIIHLITPTPTPPPILSFSINQNIIIKPDLRHLELDIERDLKSNQNIKLDSDYQLCSNFINSLSTTTTSNQINESTTKNCQLGSNCPLRHSTPSSLNFLPQLTTHPSNPSSLHAKTVCKHWLRGLCKKGNSCEFLHEYNLRTMPECWFFGKYGFCSNGDECMYLHVDERMRVLECMDYRRGFCSKGPTCSQKHIRRPICQSYIIGFCPLGKNCNQGGHPKFETDPSPRGNPYINSFNPFDRPRGDPDRGVGAPRGGRAGMNLMGGLLANQNSIQPLKSFNDRDGIGQGNGIGNGQGNGGDDGWVQTDSGPRKKRNLDEVTCFKCGQRGHYANTCPNPMVPGNRGGVVRGPGGRLLGEDEVML
ncbi:hypothetical protein DFH28DRAFT_878486 [Melampsora americana]|nr:hypothetical protein DFH28DRAFT_878486 [Melampsora americana]